MQIIITINVILSPATGAKNHDKSRLSEIPASNVTFLVRLKMPLCLKNAIVGAAKFKLLPNQT